MDRMQDCLSNHGVCAGIDPEMRNPTRLLRIVSDGIQQRVFLTATKSTEIYRYTALSYCWGGPEEAKKMPKTTRANFTDQQNKGVPVSHLTRTFQDSIALTCKLGLEYIWIDSLCIIQGDPADWAVESAIMASVYGGAHLVIAATCGKDGDHGLYPPRAPIRRLELPITGGRSVEISAMSYQPGNWDHQTWQFGTWNTPSDSDLPLHTRAWTYQERLLAKRIVHFSPKEIVWECWTASGCECGELQSNNQVFPGSKSQYRQTVRHAGVVERLKVWDDVMAVFSVRNITQYRDRVQAIAGVATQLSTASIPHAGELGRYLCGLWEADLPMGLLWMSLLTSPKVSNHNAHRRLRGWTVPTWSWLSVQGAISHQDREGVETPAATIRDVSYLAPSVNPYGMPVELPRLTIRGLTSEVELKDSHNSTDDPYYVVTHPSSEEEYRVEIDIQIPEFPLSESRHIALRISTQEEADAVNCLVLRQVEGVRVQYERFGVASVDNSLFEEFGAEEDVVLI